MTDISEFEMVSVSIELSAPTSAGTVNRLMREAGAVLHYDVYGFPREDKGPVWQSESYAYVWLFRNGIEVAAQEDCDTIVLKYPLATIGSDFVKKFVSVVDALKLAFDGKVFLEGRHVSNSQLLTHFDELIGRLLDEWGEEPGSMPLRMMIEGDL